MIFTFTFTVRHIYKLYCLQQWLDFKGSDCVSAIAMQQLKAKWIQMEHTIVVAKKYLLLFFLAWIEIHSGGQIYANNI